MNENKEAYTSTLAWLLAKLVGTHHEVSRLLRRMAVVSSSMVLKPRLFAKFLRLLIEVARAKRQEILLLSRIEALEARHQILRQMRALKPARPRTTVVNVRGTFEGQRFGPPPPSAQVLGIFLLWALIFRHKINNKKQALAVD